MNISFFYLNNISSNISCSSSIIMIKEENKKKFVSIREKKKENFLSNCYYVKRHMHTNNRFDR